MSNALDAIAPKILARGMLQFRQQAIMPRLVNSDFAAEAAQKGDTIDIPLAQSIAVEDVVPSHTPPAPADHSAQTVSIKLNNWKRAAFYLTDKELLQVDADHNYIPLHMQEAVAALASTVNKSVLALYAHTPHVLGVPGEDLFSAANADASKATASIKPVIAARKILNKNGAPRQGRAGVLSVEDEANLMALPQFADAHRAGDASVSIDGEIGRKYGIDWYGNDDVVYHRQVDQDTMSPTKSFAKGAVNLRMTSVDQPLVPGDILVADGAPIASVKQVTDYDTGNKIASVDLALPLNKAVTSATQISRAASHYNNLVFHADAFALAMRPLTSAVASTGLGSRILAVTDPESGLSMRLEISRQYKQTVWEFDVLWGVALVRPDWAVRIVG